MNRQVRFLLWALFGLFLVFVYARYNPVANTWMPKCPFKLLTGWQCPGCGMQRFLHALLHGNLREAMSYNYYLVLVMPYLLLLLLRDLMPKGASRERLTRIVEHKILIGAYIATYVIWLFVRNILHI